MSRSQNVKQGHNVAFPKMFRNRNSIELSNPKYGSRHSGEVQQMRVADFLLPNTGGGVILWPVVTLSKNTFLIKYFIFTCFYCRFGFDVMLVHRLNPLNSYLFSLSCVLGVFQYWLDRLVPDHVIGFRLNFDSIACFCRCSIYPPLHVTVYLMYYKAAELHILSFEKR